MMHRVEDLCISCKHFDRGNWECKKGFYLDGDSSKVTVECECYEQYVKEKENKDESIY